MTTPAAPIDLAPTGAPTRLASPSQPRPMAPHVDTAAGKTPRPTEAISAERTSSLDSSASSDPGFPEPTSSFDSTDSPAARPKPTSTPRPTPSANWIGTTHARRLLEVGSENTIKNWVRYGYLRGRRLPNGRIQVLLADVLRIRSNPAILQS
jgi:hypothetical protein